MKQKLLSLLLALFASICVALANDSGTCGRYLQWYYNSTTHALTITGSGVMDWSSWTAPWYSYRSEITSVSLPNGLTYISSNAFEECTGITSITIPNSVTGIGKEVFYACTGLTSITIPESLTSIGERAFYDCTGLTSVNITDIEAWCRISFNYIYSNPLYYAHNLYLNGSLVTNLTIPNSVTSIWDYAFYNCTRLTSVTIPNSVRYIGRMAFYNCTGLTSVTIGNSVTSIRDYAFYNCTGLTSVTIGNSVGHIGISAFEGCTGLTSITILNSVTSIGDYAFSDCTGLTSVTNYAAQPQTINSYVFANSGNLGNKTLYVPSGSVVQYRTANVWREFSIRAIGATALENISADGVSSIRKVIEDGKVVIVMPDGRKFDSAGRQIK